jgi:hypothetical protein
MHITIILDNRDMKKNIFLALSTLLAITILFMIFKTDNLDEKYEKRLLLIDKCLKEKDLYTIDNNHMRFICAAKSYGTPSNLDELTFMTKKLIDKSKDDEILRSACHDILHNIGVSAWNKFKEKSLIENLYTCGMGYYHGLMSQSLSSNIEKDIKLLKDFCEKFGKDEISLNSQCAHGIGHGIGMNNIPIKKQLELCSNIIINKKEWSLQDTRQDCISGSFNQYFLNKISNDKKIAENIKECETLNKIDLLECYKFSLMYTNASYEKIKIFCENLVNIDKYIKNGCLRSVAMSAAHNYLFTGENSPGYKAILLPTEFLKLTNNICSNDYTSPVNNSLEILEDTHPCYHQLYLEVSELVLNPTLLQGICNNAVKEHEKIICNNVVRSSKKIHDLSQG